MGHFDHLNVAFFTKAAIYPGSIGTFRYRFQREGWTDGKGVLTVWVYENTSFELAKDVESQTFPWTEAGVEQVKVWLEQKLEESRFTRVHADIIDRLIVKEDAKKTDLTKDQSDNLTEVFRSQMPKLDKAEFFVEIQALGEQNQPVLITQNEYMRRMKAMSQFQAGMNFYGQMPDSYNIVLNSDHALVKKVLEDAEANTADALKPILAEIKGQEARLAVLHQEQGKKKPEEITQEEKDDVHNTEKAISDEKAKRNDIISGYAKNNNIVHQLIDLALLQNGMLKGASLDAFLKRSVDMIK